MTPDRTRTAARLRYYRLRAGKSAQDIARQLGINDAWYHDLEERDDELASTLTVFQAVELASLIGVRLCDLAADTPSPSERLDLMDLPSRIEEHLTRTGVSIEQLEQELGWELQEFLKSPLQIAAESPLEFLQAIAERLGIDWLSLVPDEHSL
jgi:transcriptional regulator with XRE-family HTH domain